MLECLGQAGQRLIAVPVTQQVMDVCVARHFAQGYGIFAPAATPAAIVQQMSSELQHIFQQPDVQARLLPLGYEISPANAEPLRATVASDLDKWGKLARTVGIKPE